MILRLLHFIQGSGQSDYVIEEQCNRGCNKSWERLINEPLKYKTPPFLS